MQAATFHRFPLDAIVFEITEGERMVDMAHMRQIATEYARHGFLLALDDFGAGFSGLNLLSELEGIRLIKLDGIESNARAEQIVRAIVALCQGLDVRVLAECVETEAEFDKLRELGVRLMQGYLFARPAVESLPDVVWPSSLEPVASHAPIANRTAAAETA